MAEQRKPFHETVAEKLIEQLKAGTAPWQRPWEPGEPAAGLPMNPTTGARYKGINALHLMSQDRSDDRWMTYRQAESVGAQVRKGEKGTPIQYWQFETERDKTDEHGKPVLDGDGKKVKERVELERPRAFYATVFNAEQIDGLPPLAQKQPDWNPIERAEKILEASGVPIRHSEGGKAFYRPATDQIHMPSKGQFPTDSGYYATALHELGHATGHPTRLNRDLSHPFGSEGYAKEELRAEIGSMLLGAELGIGHDPGQHVAYVGSWIKALQNDPLEVFRAAADAEKIQKFVLDYEHKQVQQQDQAQHYSDATLKALVDNHGWEVAYTGLHEPGRVDSVQRMFEGVGPLGTVNTPNGERRISAGYDEDPERRRYIGVKLGPQLIGDADGRDQKPEDIARQINAKAEQFADERRVKNGLEPIYSVGKVDHGAAQEAQAMQQEDSEQLKALRQAREHEERVRANPASTDEDKSAAKEARKTAEINVALNDAELRNRIEQHERENAAMQTESVLTALEGAGWARTDGAALASKSFQSLNVSKEAHAYISDGDGFNRSLQFQYTSEGRNVAAADGALIPIGASPARAAELATAAAARAEKSIQESYGVRLATSDKQQQDGQQEQRQAEASERQYISVPYKEKDEAKQLGARWDRQQQSWFVPAGVDAAPFAKWAQGAAAAGADAPTTQQAPTALAEGQKAAQEARQYLAVPYGERMAAKAAGAEWDRAAKSWFVGPGADPAKLDRWKPENVKREQDPAMTPEEEFGQALKSMGFVLDADARKRHPIMDGSKQRIATIDDKKGETSGFYVGHLDGHPAGYIKNNRSGVEMKWKSKGYSLDPDAKAALQAEAATKLAERAAEQEKKHEAVADRVTKQAASLVAVEAPTTYMQAKGIQPAAGALTDAEGLKTYLPAFDADGKQWTMQFINEDGSKRFAKDSRKEGAFHPVGGMDALSKAPALVIAEGYATAATLKEATGHATVAAFDSGNLPAVAKALHAKYPEKPIVIAGEDDRAVEAKHGRNPGRVKAEEAAKAVGGVAVFPIFAPGEKEADPSLTDFNDLAARSSLGKEAVERQIKPVLAKAIETAERKQLAAIEQQREQEQPKTQKLEKQAKQKGPGEEPAQRTRRAARIG